MAEVDGRSLVLAAADIVGVISRTVSLRKRGRNYLGLCPFHQEKTPSFNVNPEKQMFYCFGCKASGNVIDFVMKRDRVEFLDALRQLALEANVELPRLSGATREKAGERQQLIDAQQAAVTFFRRVLTADSRGNAAREYLARRGFTSATLESFRVGYAPDAWESVQAAPEFKAFSPELLHTAGLLKQREGTDTFYDTFRDRVMFPIRDESGKTIALGGRILPGSDNPAKYLNSPETPIFVKSRCAYGLDLARQRIVETRTAVIVEGYTDVMMAHQYDVRNVVAPLGTALTESHVSLLRRFADRIVLLFDADAAGEGAAERSMELFLTQPVEISIASLPAGPDPDELLLEQGKVGFERVIAEAVPALDFLWKKVRREYKQNENDLTGQQRAIDAFLDMMSRAKQSADPLRWNAAMVRVSHLTQIPNEALLRRARAAAPKRPAGPAAGSGRASTSAARPGRTLPSARVKAEKQLLSALLFEPTHWTDVQKSINSADFTEPLNQKLAEVLWSHHRNEGVVPLNEFLDLLDNELKTLAVELANDAQTRGDLKKLIADSVEYFRLERQRDEERKSVSDLKAGSADEDELLRRLQEQAKRPDLRRSAG